jgi:hypothetical protein
MIPLWLARRPRRHPARAQTLPNGTDNKPNLSYSLIVFVSHFPSRMAQSVVRFGKRRSP